MLLCKCRALSLKCLVLVPFALRGVINVIKHDFSLYHVQVYVCVCGIKQAKIDIGMTVRSISTIESHKCLANLTTVRRKLAYLLN